MTKKEIIDFCESLNEPELSMLKNKHFENHLRFIKLAYVTDLEADIEVFKYSIKQFKQDQKNCEKTGLIEYQERLDKAKIIDQISKNL
jgi:hypothetical protein